MMVEWLIRGTRRNSFGNVGTWRWPLFAITTLYMRGMAWGRIKCTFSFHFWCCWPIVIIIPPFYEHRFNLVKVKDDRSNLAVDTCLRRDSVLKVSINTLGRSGSQGWMSHVSNCTQLIIIIILNGRQEQLYPPSDDFFAWIVLSVVSWLPHQQFPHIYSEPKAVVVVYRE